MNPKYQRAFDLGIAAMNKWPSTSKEYKVGQALLNWACERNREEQKVQLTKVEVVPWQERNIESVVSQ